MKTRTLTFVLALGATTLVSSFNCGSSNQGNPGGSGGSASGGSSTGGSSTGGSASGGSSTGGAAGGGSSTGGSSTGGAATGGSASGGSSTGGAATGGSATGGSSTGGSSSGGSGGTPAGGASGTGGGHGGGPGGSTTAGTGGQAGGSGSGSFTLTSPDQAEGAKFSMMFTCAANNGTLGGGVNPELDWSGAPDGTKSFAMTFIDTKIGEASAMGQHWAMWDVPPTATKMPKGTTMLTGELMGAKQTNKFLAPCPSGNDTYEFKLFALSTAMLNVTGAEGTGVANSAGVKKVLDALKALTPLGTATLHGTSGPMGQ